MMTEGLKKLNHFVVILVIAMGVTAEVVIRGIDTSPTIKSIIVLGIRTATFFLGIYYGKNVVYRQQWSIAEKKMRDENQTQTRQD